MDKVTIIGVDLAKRSFQVHGASADGSVLIANGWRAHTRPIDFSRNNSCDFKGPPGGLFTRLRHFQLAVTLFY